MEQAENQPGRRCRQCGTALTSETAGGLCPRCLLEMNFASRTMPGGEASPQMPPPSPEEMTEHFPQFEILECLGRGGMGIVYKARQKTLDRLVAIKVLAGEWSDDPQFAERFSREARTLAKLSHPNIVTVHDFGESDGMFYLVMEFIDGVNLRDVLRDGRMEPAEALAIVPSICGALQFAHDHGIVHRDIKPENILLDRDGWVKIADFGIATLVGADADRSGTPPYMAPEQQAARGPIDHRADIYALGVVFYEMLTGERPEQDPSRPSGRVEIDVRIDEIVLRALEKEPARRYQTAGELRTVLETIALPGASRMADTDASKSSPEPETALAKKAKTALRAIVFHAVVIQVAWLILAFGLHLLGDDLESVSLNRGHGLSGVREFLITLSRDGWLAWSVVPALVLVGVLMGAVGRRMAMKGLWVASAICGFPVFAVGIAGLFGIMRYGGPPMALSLVAAPVWLGGAWLTAGFASLRRAGSRSGKVAWWALGMLLGVVFIVLLTLLSLPASKVALLFSFVLCTIVGLGSLICGLAAWRTRLGRGVVLGWGTAAILIASCYTIVFGMTIRRHREAALAHEPAVTTPQQVARDYLKAAYSGDVERALGMVGGPLGKTPKELARNILTHQAVGRESTQAPEPGEWHEDGLYAVTNLDFAAGIEAKAFMVLERLHGEWKVVGGGMARPDLSPADNLETFKRFRSVDRGDRDEVAETFVRAVRQGDSELAIMLAGLPMPLDPETIGAKFSEAKSGGLGAELATPLKWHEEDRHAVTHVNLVADQPEKVSYLALKRTEGIWRVVWADATGPETSLADDLKRFKEAQMTAGIMVEDLAIRFLVAIREKDKKTLRDLCVDRTEGWTEALVGHFALELRERYRQQTGEDFAMLYPDPTAVRVDGDLAVVGCRVFRENQEKLGGNILVLYFCRMKSGWKVWTIRNAPESQPIEEHLKQARKWMAEPPDAPPLPDRAVKQVQLPDADRRDVPIVLDLASGEMVAMPAVEGEDKILGYFNKLGKGDLAWDGALITLRGARLNEWNEKGVWELPKPARTFQNTSSYRFQLPKHLLVTTAEGACYTIDVSAGVDGGVTIDYQRGNVPPEAGDRGGAREAADRDPVSRAKAIPVTPPAAMPDGSPIATSGFPGHYQGKLGDKQVNWRIVEAAGGFHWLENERAEVSENNRLKMEDGALLAEDGAEKFRFSPSEQGILFEMWEKKTGVKTAEINLVRKVEKTSAIPAIPVVPPVVIRTVPESGAGDVDPALNELRVTFSKPMQDGSWSWCRLDDETFPERTGQSRYLDDLKTCVLPVKLQPGRTYASWINMDQFQNFQDQSGQPAVPYLLIFKTRK